MSEKEKSHLSLFDRFVSFFSAKAAFERARYRTAASLMRKYEGAGRGRRVQNWKAKSTSANAEIESSLSLLRNRSRQLVRDNAYATNGVRNITSFMIGTGVTTQVKVDGGKKTDTENKRATAREQKLTQIWKAWAQNCDYDGRSSLKTLSQLICRGVIEGGEVFVRLRRTGRRKIMTPNGIVEIPPIQLQVLEGDFVDHKDLISSANAKGDNRIIQGIEFDSRSKRVAYHMYKDHPGDVFSTFGFTGSLTESVRVPADEVLHIFRADRNGQVRGVPWLAPALVRINDLDEYQGAQLVRQKIAACFAVFIRDLDGVDVANPNQGETEIGEKVEPGIIEHLGANKTVEIANPPTVEGYKEFIDVELHAIASALGVTYEALASDMSQVNFSSARGGQLNMMKNIDQWRSILILEQFLGPVFEWFLESLELIGETSARVRAVHTPPKREFIDPGKEITAMKEAVRSGFMTQSEAIRASGSDPDEHFKEYKADIDRLDELGIVLDTDPRQDKQQAQNS